MDFYRSSNHIYRVGALDRIAWLEHGFGTRHSGVWVHGNLVTLRQIHSDVCVVIDGTRQSVVEGDALVTDVPGHMLGVRTADCLPIFIVDGRRRAVAAVHAGWRGTARQIAVKAVEAMAARYSSRPEDLLVAIGPAICRDCYTVGPEVARQFQAWFPELAALTERAGLDLLEANRRQLIQAGLRPESVHLSGLCTFEGPQEFFSYRRGPERSGRMLSAVGIPLSATRAERP